MNNKYWRWLQLFIMFSLLLWGAVYIWKQWDEIRSISFINPLQMGILILYMVLSIFLEGLVIKFLAQPLGLQIANWEGFLLSGVTGFYNTLTPFRGGIIARGVYFKSKYNFPYSKFISTLSGKFVIYYLIGTLLGIIGVIIRFINGNPIEPMVLLIFVGSFLFLLVISLRTSELPGFNNSLINYFVRVINGWYLIRKSSKTIVILCFLSGLQYLAGTIINLTVFRMLGLTIHFWDMMIIVMINSYFLIVSFTPAGLGIQEAFLIFAASIFDIPASISIIAAIILRVFYTITVISLGAIGSGILFKSVFIKFDETSMLG